jgi:hypothetical protein
MAIEIVDLPIYPLKMVMFHSFLYVYQRVIITFQGVQQNCDLQSLCSISEVLRPGPMDVEPAQ